MGELGAEVRRLREAKGANLEQVAAATKVGVHHLRALEKGEFGGLPGDVFVRGFIRAYADFLGAQSEKLLALYRRDREQLEPGASPPGEHTVQEMSRILARSPVGSAGGSRFAVRFSLGGSARLLALQVAALATGIAGVAALAILLMSRRGQAPTQAAALPTSTPLRATRAAIPPPEAPPRADVPALVSAGPKPSDPPPPSPSPVTTAPSTAVPAIPAHVESKEAPAPGDARADAVEVPEHGVGSNVEDGVLSGRATAFHEGDAVWFWTRIDGARPGQKIRHVWLHDDREMHAVELKIGSASWRTWSRKSLRAGSAGRWTVEARDEFGRVLASEEFDCRAAR